jgi:trans-aconitate 2-methyltransferase
VGRARRLNGIQARFDLSNWEMLVSLKELLFNAMPLWDADLYLQFGQERTQAALDLAARIELERPCRIVDLGCGPGNSTAVLRARWPEAEITGLDRSAEMLAEARRAWPDGRWIEGDIADWSAAEPCDLLFSNAALQWVHGHALLIPHLLEQVAPGGALAVQVPMHFDSPLHRRMRELALDARWRERMGPAFNALVRERPEFYYDLLAPRSARLRIWETEYVQPMDSPAAILDFIRGTGLRPYLEALADDTERALYFELLADAVAHDYPPRPNGKVLFPFRRLFFIAYR